MRTRLRTGVAVSFEVDEVVDLPQGEVQHARRPFDIVLVELDADAAAVRRIRGWHPEPAIVAIAGDDDRTIDMALTAGAHDHLSVEADARDIALVVERAWRRHRAERTSRADEAPQPDAGEVRRRVAQLVSLTAAAQDLLDIDEPPHTTVRSLLEQAAELGQETVELTGRVPAPDGRTRLDLPGLVDAAWTGRGPVGASFAADLDQVDVHGHPAMLRTALVVLVTHALRGADPAGRVVVDTEVLADAVRLRVHDDGPTVGLGTRRALFVGDDQDTTPTLMAVEHVSARHGGTAWLADSDLVDDGTMVVLELPLRALPR